MKKFPIPMWAVIFSLWLPFYAGYLSVDSLSEVDFLSSVFIFENPDEENTVIDQQSRGKSLPGIMDLPEGFQQTGFLKLLLSSIYNPVSPPHSVVPLRC